MSALRLIKPLDSWGEPYILAPQEVKEAAYKGLVRPVLDYGSSVWDPPGVVLQEELESVQKRSAKFVTGNYNYETGSMTGILGQLKWVSLKKRKQVAHRATIAHLCLMCQGQISFQKIQTHLSFNACSCYMKVSKGSNQKQQRKSRNTIFHIISLRGYFLDTQGQLTP